MEQPPAIVEYNNLPTKNGPGGNTYLDPNSGFSNAKQELTYYKFVYKLITMFSEEMIKFRRAGAISLGKYYRNSNSKLRFNKPFFSFKYRATR